MTIIALLILILSIVAHEVAHGFAALWQGDRTARDAGRLTLNPIPHVDIVGSIILPVTMFIIGMPFLFGYAKPVPINPYNFKNIKYGEALVAFAGPLVNIIFVAIFTAILHTVPMGIEYTKVIYIIILTNIVLAMFNLMPIPPLDGSKILFAFIPQKFYRFRKSLENKGFLFWFIIIILIWQVFQPLTYWIFETLVS
ncbi:site-2 protease family protein [Candidatus Parcubacteria bacterium]|nr:site-2 protease family protein [Candidatus Parcubacteria bacterium]